MDPGIQRRFLAPLVFNVLLMLVLCVAVELFGVNSDAVNDIVCTKVNEKRVENRQHKPENVTKVQSI